MGLLRESHSSLLILEEYAKMSYKSKSQQQQSYHLTEFPAFKLSYNINHFSYGSCMYRFSDVQLSPCSSKCHRTTGATKNCDR